MTNNATYDFTQLPQLLDRAGISVAEAALLFKVSRPTLYSWREGNAPTQGFLLANAERLIRVISEAVDAGAFKGFQDIPKEERMAELVRILRRHLNGN